MLIVLLVSALFYSAERWISFLRYGGEIITYDKNSQKTIQHLYELLINEINKRNEILNNS